MSTLDNGHMPFEIDGGSIENIGAAGSSTHDFCHLLCFLRPSFCIPFHQRIKMENTSEDFKWFGEGFDGFPKRLPEDCVEYAIYVIDEKLRRNRLKEIQKATNELTKNLLKGYIWQREAFALELVEPQLQNPSSEQKTKKDASPHPYFLRGRTNFGDSIADEWLIVYLLRELSKKFPDAWIRVFDTDGEFLLIEAANSLPKWVDPDIAEHRVWINKGQLRIIPLQRDAVEGSGPKTPGLPANATLRDAIGFIKATPASVLHYANVEDEAFNRLREYPTAIQTSMHHAILSLPRNLAYILRTNPSCISAAVEAFYLRDPIAVKPLSTKDTGTLIFAPEDFIRTSVKFTKVLFAQLHSQEFPPPPSWSGIRPHIADHRVNLGMKLTCGFEMLIRDPANKDKRAVREINLLLSDLETGDDSLPTDAEIASWELREDDEKWLDINFADFEKELNGQKQQTGSSETTKATTAADPTSASGFGDPATQTNLRNLVSRFENFMEDEDEGGSSDDASETSSISSESSSGEDKANSFTDAEFETAMREMMGMPAAEIESSGLLDEARKLALEMEDSEEGERDEEAEVKEIMARMERELKGHGVLDRDGDDDKSKKEKGKGKESKGKGKERERVVREDIARETLRGMNGAKGGSKRKGKQKVTFESEEESSGDDEDHLGDVDVDMLKNMLEAFKGQAGMAGPAGNLMNLMGVQMPRDESRVEEEEEESEEENNR